MCFQKFSTLPILPTFWGCVFFKILLHYLHYLHYIHILFTLPELWGKIFFGIQDMQWLRIITLLILPATLPIFWRIAYLKFFTITYITYILRVQVLKILQHYWMFNPEINKSLETNIFKNGTLPILPTFPTFPTFTTFRTFKTQNA